METNIRDKTLAKHKDDFDMWLRCAANESTESIAKRLGVSLGYLCQIITYFMKIRNCEANKTPDISTGRISQGKQVHADKNLD